MITIDSPLITEDVENCYRYLLMTLHGASKFYTKEFVLTLLPYVLEDFKDKADFIPYFPIPAFDHLKVGSVINDKPFNL